MAAASKAIKAAKALTRNASHFVQQTSSTTPNHASATIHMATVTTASTSTTLQQHAVPIASTSASANSTVSAMQAPLPRSSTLPSTTVVTSTAPPIPRALSTKLLRRPIPNSYWATPTLLACEYPWAPRTPRPKLDALLAAGVRTFIDLTESGELLTYSQLLPARARSAGLSPREADTLEYARFPIPDRAVPQSRELLARIMAVLRDCTRRGRVAAVHCRGGIGRTGTVVGCWLVESGAARDGEEALRMIAAEWKTVEKCRRFPCSPETGPQFEFVRNFKPLEA